MRYEIGQEGEAGGVHVRQSPFDPNLVDIKLLDRTGVDISSSQERSIEQLFLREDFKRATPDRVGEIITPPARAGILPRRVSQGDQAVHLSGRQDEDRHRLCVFLGLADSSGYSGPTRNRGGQSERLFKSAARDQNRRRIPDRAGPPVDDRA